MGGRCSKDFAEVCRVSRTRASLNAMPRMAKERTPKMMQRSVAIPSQGLSVRARCLTVPGPGDGECDGDRGGDREGEL